MLRLPSAALVVLVAASFTPALAENATETANLTLERLAPTDALSLLRTMAGAGSLQVIDEHTVRVTDTAETIQLARETLDCAENPSKLGEEKVPIRKLDDDSVIACVHLQHASVKEVGTALRSQLQVAKIAMNTELRTVMVRDTTAKVQAAIEVIRGLEEPARASELNPGDFALWSNGSPVRLDPATEAELASSLMSYITSCHPFESVTGQVVAHSQLSELWAAQALLAHGVLRATFSAAASPPLSGRSGEALVGLGETSGPSPVLFRDHAGKVTSLIKCPGLDGLLLTCRVHSVVPGMSPSPECARWRELRSSPPSVDPPPP